MRRTISVKVYKAGDYSQVLDNSSGHSVRLLYAVPVGSELVPGGVVPGQGFGYVGEGVWEREINTGLINENRTDYYYLQYSENGSSWVDVAGYNPFYFNTKISTDKESQHLQPRISDKTPDILVVEENAMSIDVSFSGKYGNSDDVNDTHIREFIYVYESKDRVKRTTYENSISIPRVGEDSKLGDTISLSLRIVNPSTGEISKAREDRYVYKISSIAEILSASDATKPPFMDQNSVSETSLLGIDDAYTVNMPSLPNRGQHSELAIQYGGVPFTISGNTLVNFAGTIIPCTVGTLTIPKPLFFSSENNVYMAYRVVGFNNSSGWSGKDDMSPLSVKLNNPEKSPIMSDNIIEGIVDSVIARVETSSGETIARRIGSSVNS